MNPYKHGHFPDARRISGVRFLIIAAFVFLTAYLWRMQVLNGGHYYRMALNNSVRLVRRPAPRGLIFDRAGMTLVDNRPSFDVEVVLEDVEDEDFLVKKLSGILGLPEEEVRKRKSGYRTLSYLPVTIASDIDMEKVLAIEGLQPSLAGVRIGVYPRRRYVYGDTAAHVLGYVGKISPGELELLAEQGYTQKDLIGKAGLEKQYERILSGTSGGEEIQVDSRGYLDRVLYREDPVPGCDIHLNLDISTQRAAESALKDASGAVVAVDPRNGAVLAMASSPSYNPNDLVPPVASKTVRNLFRNEEHPMVNRCVQGVYPPGSTFKPLVALAALDSGAIEKNTTFKCIGYFMLGRHPYRCWYSEGHGYVSVVDAIMLSCNVFFYNAGRRAGRAAIVDEAREFGMTEETGIDLPSEKCGVVPTEEWLTRRGITRWNPGDTVVLAIGQGYLSLTPLRAAMNIVAIANGGKIYRPRVVNRVVSPIGDTMYRYPPELMKEVSLKRENLKLVREGLRKAIGSVFGTGKKAALEEVDIAGKTGTVQIGPEGARRNHSWFVGYAPYESPRIVVAVILEEKESGGFYAAPAAQKIFAAYFGVKVDT
jgi:penicillin-binding protein 2